MSLPVLDVTALSRRFGSVRALRDVSFQIHPGELLLLLGANGAGKSTLLRCVAGLVRPAAGRVVITGRDLRSDAGARAAVGFLSHHAMVYDDLTPRENLRFAATLHGLADSDARVRDALDAAGLTPRADERVAVLSHGSRQRLAIARATLHAPALLLLDEPFTGLDHGAGELLRATLARALSRQGAVLCATHRPEECWDLVTRVIALARGSIAFDVPRPESIEALLSRYHPLAAA